MKTITVELTYAQYAAFQYVAVSPEEWANNAISERCRIAGDEIIKIAVDWYLTNGIQVPGTRDEIITDAFDRGIVQTATDRQAAQEQA